MNTREELLAAAAKKRAAEATQRRDRPRARRDTSGAAVSLPHVVARAKIEIRGEADADTVHYNGFASTYEQPYEMYDMFGPYTEVVTAGAGAVSLARADLDVPFVLQHESLRRIARTTNGTLQLSETDHGLEVDAPSLDMRDQDVAYIVPKLRAGLIDEMSFAFRIQRGMWSPDYTEYRIEEYDIHRGDVAIVGYGANPFTSGALREADSSHKRGRDLIAPDEIRLFPAI